MLLDMQMPHCYECLLSDDAKEQSKTNMCNLSPERQRSVMRATFSANAAVTLRSKFNLGGHAAIESFLRPQLKQALPS